MENNYKTFKQLVSQLAEVRTREDLWTLCGDIDRSYQHEKITYKDNETLYQIINHVVKRELIGYRGANKMKIYEMDNGDEIIEKIKYEKGQKVYNYYFNEVFIFGALKPFNETALTKLYYNGYFFQ